MLSFFQQERLRRKPLAREETLNYVFKVDLLYVRRSNKMLGLRTVVDLKVRSCHRVRNLTTQVVHNDGLTNALHQLAAVPLRIARWWINRFLFFIVSRRRKVSKVELNSLEHVPFKRSQDLAERLRAAIERYRNESQDESFNQQNCDPSQLNVLTLFA